MGKQKNGKGQDSSLEHDLRNMILGNITIADSSTARPQQSPRRDNSHRHPQNDGRNSGGPNRNARQLSYGQGQQAAMSEHTYYQPSMTSPNSRALPQDTGRNFGSSGQRIPAQNSFAGHFTHQPQNQPGQNNGQRTLYQPPAQVPTPPPYEVWAAQCLFLEQLVSIHIPESQMTAEEMATKDAFRSRLETICRTALSEYDGTGLLNLQLKAFGSFSSGFATKGSDMDLSIALSTSGTDTHAVTVEPPLLRALEKALLNCGLGARLLTRTRVPIIKICETPTEELLYALVEERRRWEALPEDEKYVVDAPAPQQPVDPKKSEPAKSSREGNAAKENANSPATPVRKQGHQRPESTSSPVTVSSAAKRPQNRGSDRAWLREKKRGPLDFPKNGVGVQCDINFSNDLALHNTRLLRCYCLCDVRVQPMVLFVKAWAKRRKINSSYSGTLSSYGYVLMVLHFLANIASPPVIPNLQLSWRPPQEGSWRSSPPDEHYINNYDVRFWSNEDEIKHLAEERRLTTNNEPIGALLRNFFQYYAHPAVSFGTGRGFQWTQDVLSLRTAGGTMKKAVKGWTGAKTTTVGHQEVRNRYLFAIEDPFEIDHNVARTVTHHGIIAIRDEFRRAWKIISSAGGGLSQYYGNESLFAEVTEDDVIEESGARSVTGEQSIRSKEHTLPTG
ncbi:PAP/OAS1 substrate-binding domain-containing protein [Pseudovirgaria hyperparasitica]|uniref:polynucleotide adenylyltransferase n=1 Tax=Pseudovirgaria hyperparasitica TaxID=470096 RepID=A0A6A6WGL4_9PEZI|nr:PAP/OAS1 substrate-binding domain-containing protein [Pseudovirgaria hyperparasitica]KAF2761106.1 PAP/OAS1 substrate-binding domain-containing protein [Pseudovirgaria hyperparasitica]